MLIRNHIPFLSFCSRLLSILDSHPISPLTPSPPSLRLPQQRRQQQQQNHRPQAQNSSSTMHHSHSDGLDSLARMSTSRSAGSRDSFLHQASGDDEVDDDTDIYPETDDEDFYSSRWISRQRVPGHR